MQKGIEKRAEPERERVCDTIIELLARMAPVDSLGLRKGAVLRCYRAGSNQTIVVEEQSSARNRTLVTEAVFAKALADRYLVAKPENGEEFTLTKSGEKMHQELEQLAVEILRRLLPEGKSSTSVLQPYFAGWSREQIQEVCVELVRRGRAVLTSQPGEMPTFGRVRGVLV
jgi:hypothetical protein